MKSIKLTIIYFIAFLFGGLFFSFFAFPARAEACEVDLSDGALRFRTANGVVNQPLLNWFEEDQQKYIYLDIKTYGSDCTETDVFYLTIFGIDEDGDIEKTVENYAIPAITVQQNNGSSIAMIPTEKACFGDNSDNSTVDCLMFAMITDTPTNNPQVNILGIVGNLISLISPQQAQTFISQFGVGGLSPNPTCDSSSGYLYATSINCVLTAATAFAGLVAGDTPQKLINYYNTYGGNYTLVNPQVDVNGTSATVMAILHPVGLLTNPDVVFELEEGAPPFHTIALPGLLYGCDGICDLSSDNWTVSNNLLPYGGSHSNDQGAIAASPLSDIYQEDYIPLAPLPFEGLSGGPTPELGEYLAAIFRMAIVVTVILAVVMIVFHGIGYALTDVIGKKTDHKDGVKNAILGLVLALGSWLILNTVSPRLASQLRIGLPNVNLEGDAESISINAVTTGTGVITGFSLPQNMNLFCPLSGGVNAVPNIIDSFDNKVTYRWGGKGGGLPSGASFPRSPNESNNGDYMCNQNGQSVPCRNFCPDNSVCLDCSGFVNHVRKCAGLSIYAGTSSMTQSSNAIPVDMDTLSSNGQSLSVNGSTYTLQPGDILVWSGHVVIYYGNGTIAESRGDLSSIKNPNQNIKKTSLAQSNYRNSITHLIKANP